MSSTGTYWCGPLAHLYYYICFKLSILLFFYYFILPRNLQESLLSFFLSFYHPSILFFSTTTINEGKGFKFYFFKEKKEEKIHSFWLKQINKMMQILKFSTWGGKRKSHLRSTIQEKKNNYNNNSAVSP